MMIRCIACTLVACAIARPVAAKDVSLSAGLEPPPITVQWDALVAQDPPKPQDPQQKPPDPGNPAQGIPPVPPHTGFKALAKDVVLDFRHLPSKNRGKVLAIGAVLTLLALPLDDHVNKRLYSKGAVHKMFLPGKIIGYGTVQAGAALGAWVYGRATDKRGRVAHLGLDLLRANIVTQTLTYGLKYTIKRDRPDNTGYGFPSGHSSVTFATATVLERHLGWRAAVPTYLVASYVAASRLHENRHFLSDVVFGGTVGLIVGRAVTRHGKGTYALMPEIGPRQAGFVFVFHGKS